MNQRCADKQCADGPRNDDQQPQPRWAALGLLCARCADHLEQNIGALPAAHDQLRTVLAGSSRNPTDGSKPTKGNPPVPLNLDAHDHLEHMHHTITSWTRLVCEERGLRGPDRNTVAALAPWLLAQHDWLIDQPWAPDLADELRDLNRHTNTLTRSQPRQHRLPAPCPTCNEQQLTRWDGADHITCDSCGRVWTEADYTRLVLVLTSDSGTSITAAEAATRANVPPSTFRRWVSERKIRKLGTIDGLARYSTRDLDTHLRGTAQQEIA